MKFEELLAIVNDAYPDGLVAQHWDDDRQCPKRGKEAEEVGDTLARFILLELLDTFDPCASDDRQFDIAIRAMDRAVEQVREVSKTLGNAQYLAEQKAKST